MVPVASQERRTQFAIDLAYGGIFLAGFALLVWSGFDARIAAFLGGIVAGYFLHVWEKMSTYERVLEEAVSLEVQQQVGPSVEAEVQEQVAPEVEREVEQTVEERVEAEVERKVEEELDREEQASA